MPLSAAVRLESGREYGVSGQWSESSRDPMLDGELDREWKDGDNCRCHSSYARTLVMAADRGVSTVVAAAGSARIVSQFPSPVSGGANGVSISSIAGRCFL